MPSQSSKKHTSVSMSPVRKFQNDIESALSDFMRRTLSPLDIQQLVKMITAALRSFTVGLITRLDSQIHECDTESENAEESNDVCETESENEESDDASCENACETESERDESDDAFETDSVGDENYVDHIVSHRGTPKRLDKMRFRVRWLNFGPVDDTEEPFENVRDNEQFQAYCRKKNLRIAF